MKRAATLLTIVLASLFLYAQQSQPSDQSSSSQSSTSGQSSSGQSMMMTGTVCSSGCVDQSSGKATCKSDCTEKTGDTVFIDDSGKVSKISNPEMVKNNMGQKVKVKCHMSKDGEAMEIEKVILSNAG